MAKQMPPRKPEDGPVSANRSGEDRITLTVSHLGEMQQITMSEYNAWRAFGMLALMLGISLPKKLAETIRF